MVIMVQDIVVFHRMEVNTPFHNMEVGQIKFAFLILIKIRDYLLMTGILHTTMASAGKIFMVLLFLQIVQSFMHHFQLHFINGT